MKTVVEKIDGTVYVYVNTEKHFKRIQNQLRGQKFTAKDLDNQCDFSMYPDNCHIVIEGSPK